MHCRKRVKGKSAKYEAEKRLARGLSFVVSSSKRGRCVDE